MVARPPSRMLTFQVTVSILVLAVAMAGLIGAFGLFAMLRADRSAAARQGLFIERGLAEQRADLAREQESVAVWDDSVTFAKAGDQAWMEENLTVWLSSYYGHDHVYVLDERNRPVQATNKGLRIPTTEFDRIAPRLAAAIDEVRRSLTQPAWLEEGTQPAVTTQVALPAGPALVGVMPLVPSSSRVTQAPGSEYLHVTVQRIDADLIGRIAEQYQLADARVLGLTETAAATVPIVDGGGRLLGHIGWRPDRPGLAFVKETAPAMLAAAVLALALFAYLIRRLRRLSHLLHQSREEAEHLSLHDPLTGLPNRALFEQDLGRCFVAAAARGERVALLYLDLDRFKQVNDTLGHAAGDGVIREVAARLRSATRSGDTVARLGGDEFAILLTGISGRGTIEAIAELVLNEIARPFSLDAEHVSIGVSIGIATGPGGAVEPGDLLRQADKALYRAKRLGGDRYALHGEGEAADAAGKDAWRSATGLTRIVTA